MSILSACHLHAFVTTGHSITGAYLLRTYVATGQFLPATLQYPGYFLVLYCRHCPGFELGTAGFVAWRSTTEPPQPPTESPQPHEYLLMGLSHILYH